MELWNTCTILWLVDSGVRAHSHIFQRHKSMRASRSRHIRLWRCFLLCAMREINFVAEQWVFLRKLISDVCVLRVSSSINCAPHVLLKEQGVQERIHHQEKMHRVVQRWLCERWAGDCVFLIWFVQFRAGILATRWVPHQADLMQKKCLMHYIRCGGARAREMNFINHSRALSVSPAARLHGVSGLLNFAEF